VIEEDERTDHAPLCEGQDPPHFERTDAAPALLYHELDHEAGIAKFILMSFSKMQACTSGAIQ
jgi:hypothetical protein